MKHAGKEALEELDPLLRKVRGFDALTEKQPGVFYRKSNAFLHFHEDPAGLFADLKMGQSWKRLPMNSRPDRELLLREIRSILK